MVDLISVWEKHEVLPVTVTEYGSGKVLMIGYQTKESLALTLKTGKVYYYDLNDKKVYKKGHSSGHSQRLMSATMNCSLDAFWFVVEQKGTVCHTGHSSCFIHEIYSTEYTKHEKFGRLILDDEK